MPNPGKNVGKKELVSINNKLSRMNIEEDPCGIPSTCTAFLLIDGNYSPLYVEYLVTQTNSNQRTPIVNKFAVATSSKALRCLQFLCGKSRRKESKLHCTVQ